jgi:hypothetical protein
MIDRRRAATTTARVDNTKKDERGRPGFAAGEMNL